MLGSVFKFFLAVLILVAAGAFFLGYGFGDRPVAPGRDVVGTTGSAPETDASARGREAGAAIGEAVGAGAERAERALERGTLTAKVKAKMALDDLVRAAAIDVDTAGTVVTLSGTVASEAERARAVQLARETEGVTAVTDRLVVR